MRRERYYQNPAKCIIAFQLEDGTVIYYRGWATDADIVFERSYGYGPEEFEFDNGVPIGLRIDETRLEAKISMRLSSTGGNDDPAWGTIRKPPEIENMREIDAHYRDDEGPYRCD